MQTKTKALLAILVCSLLVMTNTVTYIFAATPPTITYLTSGALTSKETYIIWEIGANSYIKNGETGQITSDSSTATLFNSYVTDNSYFILKGVINLDNEFVINGCDNVTVTGQDKTTKLILDSGVLKNVFHIINSDSVTISNLEIDGNEAGNPIGVDPYNGHGILVRGSSYFKAHDNYIHDCAWGGIAVLYEGERSDYPQIYHNRIHTENYAPIQLGGNAANGTLTIQGGLIHDNIISGNSSERVGNVGIVLFQCQQLSIHNNIITGVGDDCIAFDYSYEPFPYHIKISDNEIEQGNLGIYISDSLGGDIITGNTIRNCRYQGMAIWSSNEVISNNIIYGNARQGIYIIGGYNTITGNIIKNNGQVGEAQGILLYGSETFFNTLSGNIIYDDQGSPTQEHGILESNGADANVIISCNTLYNTVAGISVSGVNTKVISSWNGTGTWVSAYP